MSGTTIWLSHRKGWLTKAECVAQIEWNTHAGGQSSNFYVRAALRDSELTRFFNGSPEPNWSSVASVK